MLHTQEKDSLLRIRVCNKIVGDAPVRWHWRTLQYTSFYFECNALKTEDASAEQQHCLHLIRAVQAGIPSELSGRNRLGSVVGIS